MTHFARVSLKAKEPPEPTRSISASVTQKAPPVQWPGNQRLLQILSAQEAFTPQRREPSPEEAKRTVLIDKLKGRAIEEIRNDRSYKVLLQIVLVAQKNHVLRALAEDLDAIELLNGTYLDLFLQTFVSAGDGGIRDIVVELLAKEGIHREDSPQVMAMGPTERLWAAAFLGAPEVPKEVVYQIVVSLPWIAGFWVVSHAFGPGELLDLLGIAFLGQMAVQVVRELFDYYTLAKNARNDTDLRAASKHFASVVAMLGIAGLAVLAKRLGPSIKKSAKQLGRRALAPVLAAALKGTGDATPALALDAAPKANFSVAETRPKASQAIDSARQPRSVQPERSVSSSNSSSVDDLNVDQAFAEHNDPRASQANGSRATSESTAARAPAPETVRGAVDRSPSAIADRGYAEGLTRAQAAAAKQAMTKLTAGQGTLGRVWESVTRSGDRASLRSGNARTVFTGQRRRFWAAVFDNPEARALFENMGAIFGKRGTAPVLRLPNGQRLQMTIDHIVEIQTDPTQALDAANLQVSPRLENTVLLRLIHYYDALKRRQQ